VCQPVQQSDLYPRSVDVTMWGSARASHSRTTESVRTENPVTMEHGDGSSFRLPITTINLLFSLNSVCWRHFEVYAIHGGRKLQNIFSSGLCKSQEWWWRKVGFNPLLRGLVIALDWIRDTGSLCGERKLYNKTRVKTSVCCKSDRVYFSR